MQPDLAYNKALCFYHMRQYAEGESFLIIHSTHKYMWKRCCNKLLNLWWAAMKILSDIIEHGVQEYPELSVGRYDIS